MTNSASTASKRKAYDKPEITAYSVVDVLKLIGPAVANYGGTGTNP